MAALFETDVVVIGHAVVALHPEAVGEQEAGEVKADEACGAGDQNLAHGTPLFWQ